MDIVADIGGTKTRVAGTRDREAFFEPIVMDTPGAYDEALAAIQEAIRTVAGGQKVEKIAAAISGALSKDRRSLTGAHHHLPDWLGKDLAGDLGVPFEAETTLTNDTEQVGLGEAVYGAGKGANIVVYITVSTGVNGARIVNGEVEPTAFGYEIGGQYLMVDGIPQTFEDLVSGGAIEKKYGKHPKELGADSPVWEELAKTTAYGVHNTILHWSPERVVLGGSMFNEVGIKVDRVEAHVREYMKKFPDIPEIVHSDLKDFGGLYGGLVVLRGRYPNSPAR